MDNCPVRVESNEMSQLARGIEKLEHLNGIIDVSWKINTDGK